MTCDELYHYGTPRHSGRYPYGSGKRPYQHDVYAKRAYKASQTRDDVEDIFKTLSKDEKRLLGVSDPDASYRSIEEGSWVIKRFLAKCGNVPVAFLELTETADKRGVRSCSSY